MAQTITRDELWSAIEAGEVTPVETLGTEHFEQGHLPGALDIHFEAVKAQAPKLLPDKHAAIVTYCSNTACRNSEIAANQLTAMGYSSVRKYAEGKDDWTKAGLPLETLRTDRGVGDAGLEPATSALSRRIGPVNSGNERAS